MAVKVEVQESPASASRGGAADGCSRTLPSRAVEESPRPVTVKVEKEDKAEDEGEGGEAAGVEEEGDEPMPPEHEEEVQIKLVYGSSQYY